MNEQYLPGTTHVEWWVERLTGGIDPDMVDAEGGPVHFAIAIADTGCCCERDGPRDESWVNTCLACEAQSLLRAIAGEPLQDVEFNEVVGPF